MGALKANKMTGEWRAFHAGGKSKSTANYSGGVLDGAYQDWHANGTTWTKGSFEIVANTEGMRNAQEVGVWTGHYASGASFYEADFTKGSLKALDEGGNTLIHATEKRGNQWFEPASVVLVTAPFKDGKPKGTWTWSREGAKVKQVEFAKARLDGKAQTWHSTGSLATQGNYKQGQRNGQWLEWGPYGELLTVTCLQKGERVWMTFELPRPKRACP